MMDSYSPNNLIKQNKFKAQESPSRLILEATESNTFKLAYTQLFSSQSLPDIFIISRENVFTKFQDVFEAGETINNLTPVLELQ